MVEKPGGDWWILTLLYESNQFVPVDGLVLTSDIEQVGGSVRVYIDLDGKKIGEKGQGTGKLVTATNFKVTTYSKGLPNIAVLRQLTVDPKVNSNTVRIPNVFGTGQFYDIPPGKLLYANFTPSLEGDLIKVVHELHYRDSWLHEQRGVDMVGDATAAVETRRIIETADFSIAGWG